MSISTTSPPASKKPRMSEVPNEKVVSLQIGESRFQVSGATFNKLKPGVFTVIQGDTYYVDRDGDIFKYILKYLRNKAISFPNDFKDGELLMKEAEFYGLSELKEQFKNGSGKPEIVTLWSMTPEGVNSPGIDIFLSWTTSKLATDRTVNWETLVKGFLDRLNKFPIRKCKDVELYSNTAEVAYDSDRRFGDEIEQIERKKCSRFAFNVDNEDVPNTIFTGLLTSGFSLVTDKSSSNVTIFKKAYKSVRELVFQRIKPVNESKVLNVTDKFKQ